MALAYKCYDTYGSLESIFDGLGLCNSCTLAIILLLKAYKVGYIENSFLKN